MSYAFESLIRTVPDWPKAGVVFRDISPALAQDFEGVMAAMAGLFSSDDLVSIDAFAGIDARGFIFASALAQRLGKNMLMIRKGGKLPPPSFRESYALEYGDAHLELGQGAGRVIVLDDVLATGGTLKAAADLCAKAGYTVQGFAVLINLTFLNDFAWQGMKVKSVLRY